MVTKILNKILLTRWFAFFHDALWIPLSLIISYFFRFNFDGIPSWHRPGLYLLIIVSIPIQSAFYWLFGLYKGMWRFASIPDLFRILKAVLLGALLIGVIVFFVNRLERVPRSVLFLYPLILSSCLCLPRLFYRWLKDHSFPQWKRDGKRILILGAGMAGQLLLRDLHNQEDYLPVGFLDDDPRKQKREIHGLPVLGGIDLLPETVARYDIEEVGIAIPSADKMQMKRILNVCNAIEIPVRILPSLQEMADYTVSSSQLRPISIEDLLGREPVTLDTKAIDAYLGDKVVMITGGGGSIGSELCRQVARLKPRRLVIFEQSEFNLYTIERQLRTLFPNQKLAVVLGDVKNWDRVDWAFRKFKPQVVFHAAAYKHVPMVEINPAEGVTNNVFGTKMVADMADRYGVERFVQVSTDKAVNPANVMGATKRVGEIYCQNFNLRSRTRFITTRFGNVLGSAGSVVPLFQAQIEAGGPITVTHPEIKRYFMTIPEAVSLILQAGSMGVGGEIFVLDMGEPVLIRDLAEQMIRLSGFRPFDDIDIVYTGLRPGEKLYEEVLHESEALRPTTHEKLLLAKSRQVDWAWLMSELTSLQRAATMRDIRILKDHLRNIVPEYMEQAETAADAPSEKELAN